VALWGVLPDLVVFTIPAIIRIWRFLTGASKTLLPGGSGPHFEWVWDSTTALIVFWCSRFVLVAAWLAFRKPLLEMLGWALHTVIDVFTHRGWFAVKFLWPVSSVHVDGVRWETPWFLAVNFAALAALDVLLWIYRVRNSSSRVEAGGNTADV
jgi:hypothetical protein